jgi:hypothetical protein
MEHTSEDQMIEGLVRKTTREELFELCLLRRLLDMRGMIFSKSLPDEILLTRDEAVSLGVD